MYDCHILIFLVFVYIKDDLTRLAAQVMPVRKKPIRLDCLYGMKLVTDSAAAAQRCCHSAAAAASSGSEVLPLGGQQRVGMHGQRRRLHGVSDGVGQRVGQPRGTQLGVLARLQVQRVAALQTLVRLAVVVQVRRAAEATCTHIGRKGILAGGSQSSFHCIKSYV